MNLESPPIALKSGRFSNKYISYLLEIRIRDFHRDLYKKRVGFLFQAVLLNITFSHE